MNQEKDQLFAQPLKQLVDFQFDDKVAKVFPDMIKRSVPGYATIINLIGILAQQYAQPNSICYDLGCSLGAATLSLAQNITTDNCRIIAVDNSEAMVRQCKVNIERATNNVPINLVCSDLKDVKIENASMVILNFTLQFIQPANRLELLSKIAGGMLPGGLLVLSEKVRFENSEQQALLTELHHAFKKANGYSELEISQKRTALENVLIPETIEIHKQRLNDAGFSQSLLWFQCFNFCSFVAIK